MVYFISSTIYFIIDYSIYFGSFGCLLTEFAHQLLHQIQEKCEDDLLKVEVERDQKMTELSKKEETALLKKDAEISRLRAEMTAKENVSNILMFYVFHLIILFFLLGIKVLMFTFIFHLILLIFI